MLRTSRERSVKIVATLGPASDRAKTIRELFIAGADVFRLNLSHGNHSELKERYQIIRELEKELGRPIGILADLQGPKLRCGDFENGDEELIEGSNFIFDLEEKLGNKKRVMLPHQEIFEVLKVGSVILVDDGKIKLEVIEAARDQINTKVLVGGKISNKKGVNIPDVILPFSALSTKDRKDLEYVCNLGVDWIGLSFVQRFEDILEAKKLIKGRASILAKIEKPAAVETFDKILQEADAIMVARGDLGVELPIYSLPPIQKKLIKLCRTAGKPVVVATQMLESMIESPSPTRAEVSDVAQAIYEGADAVMLSAESAAGKHPIKAVEMMNSVAVEIENDDSFRQIIETSRPIMGTDTSNAITVAAREVSERTDVKAICCFTHSGTTAILTSRERPKIPIIALTPELSIARKLALNWGLHCIVTEKVDRFKQAVIKAVRAAKNEGFASLDDKIIITAGVPFNIPGTTNILRVAPVNESLIHAGEIE